MNVIHPNLFILGAAKSGTTTLADALRQHSSIFLPLIKEPTFFSSDFSYNQGLDWYLSKSYTNSESYLYRCDASPSYLYFSKKVASRIKSDISNKGLKFIVIFRNPIDRAYSHYWHNFNPGENEYLSFEDALLAEKERLVTNDVDLNNTGRIRHAYFNAGLYANQLQFFFQHFSKESFLFLQFEDIFQKNFSVTMRIVQEFLQTPYEEIEYIHSNISHKFKSRTYNKLLRQKSFPKTILKKTIAPTQRTKIKQALLKANLVPRRYTPMNFATRNLLLKKFRPSIKKLESLIDKDFSAWLK